MNGDALTTKERIKDRITITVTTFDTLIDNLILAVTARIEQMCNRRFAQATFPNELHDGSDSYYSRRAAIVVKNAPIASIASVQYDAGYNGAHNWSDFYASDYTIDYEAGILYFPGGLRVGHQNVRITYTGGFTGYSMDLSPLWRFNVTPQGNVDGSNLTFTLPESADQVIVYADGVREKDANVTHVAGTTSVTLAAGRAPASTIAMDYITTNQNPSGTSYLPADLVEVAEEAVVRIFKRRESEGRTSETFGTSSITWAKSVFTDEDLGTIRNYRRGYHI